MLLTGRIALKIFCVPSLFFVMLACPSCAGMAHAQTQPQAILETKNILVLHAHEAQAPVFLNTDKGLSTTLQAGGVPLRNQFFESLDLRRNPGTEHREVLLRQMRARYGHRKIDMIITLFPEALDFVLHEGRTLFPKEPILALYLPPGFVPPSTDCCIIQHTVSLDMLGTLEIALKLVPTAKRAYVVSGTLELDRGYEAQARRDFKKWESRLDFHYLSGMPFEEILAMVSKAPPGTIILHLVYAQSVTGKAYYGREVVNALDQVSTAPLFGLYDSILGDGIVGGSLVNFEYIGEKAGELSLDILRGPQILENIPAVLDVPHLSMFDWRQLRRWNISEGALPKGSILINRELTLWDFKYYIIGGLALVLLQSLLIAGLLIHKRRRRTAEASLARAEEKYRNIFESALEGIFETSPQGQFLTANRALARMLGYDSPEEVISSIRDIADQVWADSRGRADYLRLLDKQNVVRGFECQFFHKDGTKFWVSLNTRRVTGPDGQTLFYSGFLEDITGRKVAEQALEERLKFEMMLADLSGRFINVPTDRLDAVIEDAQRLVCEHLGIDVCTLWQLSADQPGTLFLTHYHAPPDFPPLPEIMDARESVPWVLEKVLKGEDIVFSRLTDAPSEAARDLEVWRNYGLKSFLILPLSAGGGAVFGALNFNVIRDERVWPSDLVKRLQLVGQVFANALARKRTEESLRQKTEELDQFFNLSPDLLRIANTDGYSLRLNSAWERILGYTREELMAKPFFDFVHPEDLDKTREVVSTLASQQRMIHFGNRYRCKDGTYRSLEWTSAPAGNLIYAAARDVTERLKEEVEARQHREELAHVTRVAMMGELTTSLAHEINQPLTAILSNAGAAQRFLSQATPDIGEVRQILDDIIRDDRRASEVVRRVRALVKKEKPRQEPLDLNELIQQVLDLIRVDSLLQGLSIRTEFGPDLTTIQGDGIQLQQVILNLILNGAAAMRNTASGQRKIIVRTAMPDSRTLKASVTDFGTGIDEHQIERLFEPFYTTKPEGLGMGLSISQTIIKAHGGAMEAWNNREGGATFAFTLPAHQGGPS